MLETYDLDCKIHVESTLAKDDLADRVAKLSSGTLFGTGISRTVRTDVGEIEVRTNPDSNEQLARAFPEGFLHFRYVLEIFAYLTASSEERRLLVSKILQGFWSSGTPAVAACDYEAELPFGGGYNSRSVPWVALELQPN